MSQMCLILAKSWKRTGKFLKMPLIKNKKKALKDVVDMCSGGWRLSEHMDSISFCTFLFTSGVLFLMQQAVPLPLLKASFPPQQLTSSMWPIKLSLSFLVTGSQIKWNIKNALTSWHLCYNKSDSMILLLECLPSLPSSPMITSQFNYSLILQKLPTQQTTYSAQVAHWRQWIIPGSTS